MKAIWKLLFPALVIIGISGNARAQVPAATPGVTFTKDVAPILQRSCQNCHRPGSIAPMPLLTFEQARPWAKAIRENVILRNMPPWHIDPNVGITEFKNSVALSDQEIATIAKWVDSGAPQGNPSDMPPPRKFDDNDKWSIGTPDTIVELPKDLVVPGKAPDQWKNITVDPGLTEDRYIKAVEVKPTRGFRAIHHLGVTLMYPDGGQAMIQAYGIGKNGDIFEDGSGRLIKAGTKVTFGLHIHSYGEDTTTNVALGLRFYPKGYAPKYIATTDMMGDDAELDLPANTDNVRTDTYMTMMKPVRVLSFQPHMHTRGKAMCLEVILPGGGTRPGDKVQTLSCVPNYKFNWMIVYDYATDAQPLLPAGSVLHFIGWHNNTATNKLNPDPDTWVGYGQRSIDDMSHAWVTYYTLSDEDFKQQVAERKSKTKASQPASAEQQ
ncbi:MAG TPA: cytochrome c [Terriglobia bacterium]|nr:cytochrome c [Terriglobia bacterium]